MASKSRKAKQPKTPIELLVGEIQRQIVAWIKSFKKENEVHTAVTCSEEGGIQIKLEPRSADPLPSSFVALMANYLAGSMFMDELAVLIQRTRVGWYKVLVRVLAINKDGCTALVVPAV